LFVALGLVGEAGSVIDAEMGTNTTDGVNSSCCDVLIVGTGLVQSIIAAACARSASKKVIHVDTNDYYGSLDTVFTLPFLQQLYQKQQQDVPNEGNHPHQTLEPNHIPLCPQGAMQTFRIHSMKPVFPASTLTVEGTLAQTPYGLAECQGVHPNPHDQQSSLVLFSLTQWTLANGKHPTLSVSIPTQPTASETTFLWLSLAETRDIRRVRDLYIASLTGATPGATFRGPPRPDYTRGWALDATPQLLYAWGPAVRGLMTSQVADYLEFKSVCALYCYLPLATGSSRLERVPCSKNDVFASKSLGPMDKQRLMKFLQLANDYGIAMAAAQQDGDDKEANDGATQAGRDATAAVEVQDFAVDEIQSWNEKYLNQGRALSRPQNKVVDTTEMTLLKQAIENDMPFDQYLTERHKLSSPKLQALVRYTLALEVSSNSLTEQENSVTTGEGMKQLCQHMHALGRYGATAFLAPLYGCGELSQAFCRCAAVYGATYLLRRPALSIENHDVDSGSGETGESYRISVELEEDELDQHNGNSGQDQKPPSMVKCHHVVLPREALPAMTSSKQEMASNASGKTILVARQISLLVGKPLIADGPEQRHVVIFPPRSFGSQQSSTIHAIALDETLNVAPSIVPTVSEQYPPPPSCTVVHLTTCIPLSPQQDAEFSLGGSNSFMESIEQTAFSPAMEALLADAQQSMGKNSTASTDYLKADEIYRSLFSYRFSDERNSRPSDDGPDHLVPSANGIHWVHRQRPGIAVDAAFEQAEEIYRNIFPSAEAAFLELSKSLEKTIRENLGDSIERYDEDEEKAILQSAMNLIGTSPLKQE
jgi:RAB protein geranylgeranyltransferase component A